jgi:7-keto-8-aminopelargonate synthetase-like enzyme
MYVRPTFTFAHCDPESLRAQLKRRVRPAQRPVLLTDGAFATTGRIPPLHEYVSLLAAYNGRLVVDESHAFGVVGANGRGAAEHCGVEHEVVSGATLSKAYCAQGAVFAGSAAAVAQVRRASPVGAACAGSPLSAAAAHASLTYMHDRAAVREELRAKADYLRARLRQTGLDVIDTPASIVSFTYGNCADMQALQRRAFERGIHIYHSKYIGAGPEGLIRCAVFRDHSLQDIDALISVLR